MPDDLYLRDALAWSDQQASLLRRLAAGERLNETVDWHHVIEEVQDVGLSELRSCRSVLTLQMEHLLKLHAWPGSQAAEHWRVETLRFSDDARDWFTPSMRQRLDLSGAYANALRRARAATDPSGPPRALPAHCPFTIDALLDGRVEASLAAITGEGTP